MWLVAVRTHAAGGEAHRAYGRQRAVSKWLATVNYFSHRFNSVVRLLWNSRQTPCERQSLDVEAGEEEATKEPEKQRTENMQSQRLQKNCFSAKKKAAAWTIGGLNGNNKMMNSSSGVKKKGKLHIRKLLQVTNLRGVFRHSRNCDSQQSVKPHSGAVQRRPSYPKRSRLSRPNTETGFLLWCATSNSSYERVDRR